MAKFKILIVGAGAMGCRFGACFLKGGAEAVLCDIWQEHVDAINRNGLKVEDGDQVEYVKIRAVTDAQDAGAPDVVMIFTKSTQTEDAVKSALRVMQPDTPVITLQNGLGNLELIEKYIERDRLIIGCTKTATGLIAPGAIRIEGFAESDIKALGGRADAAAVAIADALEAGGMPCHIRDDIMHEIWTKLTFNSAMNTVTALTRLFPGGIGEHGVALIEKITAEVAAVAAAEGVSVDLAALMNGIRRLADPEHGEAHFTSMLQDVLRKKPTEADFICGPILRRARENGIAAPHLETVYELVKIVDTSYDRQVSF